MNSELLDFLPPQNLDAERWVLGSALIAPATLDQVGWLKPEDFHSEGHQAVYRALRAMRDAGLPIDAGLLIERLKAAGDLERAGGAAGLHEIVVAAPVPSHAVHYAQIVRRMAEYRHLIHAGTDLLRDAYAASDPVEELLARAESALLEVTTGRYRGGAVDLSEAIAAATVRMDQLQDRSKRLARMTGLPGFDETYGGFMPGELVIIAARTGIGKTALATQIAIHNARKGRLAYFVSLEMSREELATRILCRQAGVNSRDIRAGRLSPSGRSAIVDASASLSPARLKIADRPGMTVADIRREARRLAREGLALMVIDYLQLVTPRDQRVVREQQVATITRELKQAARELDIPVICLCQLNRQADGERPRLSHLRESGAIEQDADMVLFLYQHEPKDAPGEDHNAVLEVAKHRAGETSCLRAFWDGPTTSFDCPGAALGEFGEFSGSGKG